MRYSVVQQEVKTAVAVRNRCALPIEHAELWDHSHSNRTISFSIIQIGRILGAMQQSWRNLYKVSDLFFCPHRLHKHRESGASVWHILKYKGCYPTGCVSFAWKCRKFDDGHKCPRGKKHVGKDCFSCPFFYDLKLAYAPELTAEVGEYDRFRRDFADFEEWVEQLQGRRIEVRGKIKSINPLLTNHGDNDSPRIACRGALLYLIDGIFGYDLFLDPFYARLSFNVYDRAELAIGDVVDMKGQLEIDLGRFVFGKVGNINITRSGEGESIPSGQLKQAKFTGMIIDGQPAKCLRCPHGLLIDSEQSDGRSSPRRLLYCVKGVADYRFCAYHVS